MNQKRILLVEDNEDSFELVRFLLERAGYVVLAARNGRECIQIARQEKPDLILMDLSLPEMDGWTAARRLKAEAQTASIPLFALTAHTLPGDRKKAFEAGFDGYFSKPINVAGFAASIATAMHSQKTPRKA